MSGGATCGAEGATEGATAGDTTAYGTAFRGAYGATSGDAQRAAFGLILVALLRSFDQRKDSFPAHLFPQESFTLCARYGN